MRLIIAAISLAILSSCSTKMIPLKGNYPVPPLSSHSDNPVDTVWARLIDFVSEKGINVKIIDKNSGLLITEDYNLRGNIAYETKSGLSSPEVRLHDLSFLIELLTLILNCYETV